MNIPESPYQRLIDIIDFKKFEPTKTADFTNKTGDFTPVLNSSDSNLPLLDELRTFDWRAMRLELDALI
ncbi:MAG: hypothetical protein A3A98_01800 [Candidatus Staskawiczbacteria bacterium RIFCSPLOWO2_01_FULL_40_39]|uniref:Uncharacterized protein n=1 Tax=Candidatus Staskawiczbacteria bacterium RIFCSPHIGHO2_01_FULL_39_25 TaxID=1802202 RepID=A0A1G2HQ92_9BACT|nr:MAG: hypothetical protein A2730_01955 [Candidatus Staskawiczbacteria bacterium RIFCSPHIGHO2_01_FULL_39_25]OGZ72704.1 MAG: hypothetical protein A3A98_01800 [Candidatus Staskawiczbacteria bacterium RIFCSPLOWO2_01_FULL_40_39]OGZ74699.1 MAG: hypothetical protein A3I87_00725 [Candidatus Staskawiczbacteria bacterium RIFCSPLOWO2_02_FULL_39_8]